MKNIAIILAAGRGNRLRPLTDEIPKCMVTTPDGIPLLHRAARKLEEVGTTDLVLGVGFQKDSVVLPPLNDIRVHRVENDEWNTTNNIQTLSLCFDYLRRAALNFDNVFLIEGDVYLGEKVLARLLMENESATAVLPSSYTKKGSCIAVDDLGYVRILRDNSDWNDPGIFKAANIYKLTRRDWLEIGERLTSRSKSEYYEVIIAELLGKVKLKAVIDGDCREIDNSYDRYCLADSLNWSYEEIRSNWGGLWRRSVQDHFFLSNPFYPTPFIKDRLKYSLDSLISNYPSGRKRVNELLRAFCNVGTSFPLHAVNGASEAIRALEKHFNAKNVRFTMRFSPTFNEYQRFLQSGKEEANGIIVVSPNNPTAEVMGFEELRQLLVDYRYVILDLSLNTGKDTPYLELMDRYPNLIVIRSLSKVFGVPGLRIGYVAVREECIPGFDGNLPIWNINSVVEAFLELHLDCLSDYERSLGDWQRESARVRGEIEGRGIVPAAKIGGSTSFLTLVTEASLAQPLFDHYGIFVADVSHKFADGRFHTRIGIKNRKQNDYLIYALDALSRTGSEHLRELVLLAAGE